MSKICNAFEIDEIMTAHPLYEKYVKADRFAVEISIISVQLHKISGGKFKYNEDCIVFELDSYNGERTGDMLAIIIPEVPFVIFEWKGKAYAAVCPYDEGGVPIQEVIAANGIGNVSILQVIM